MNKVMYGNPAEFVRAYRGTWDEAAVELIARRFRLGRDDVDAAARAAGIRKGDRRSPSATVSRRPQTRSERMAEASSLINDTRMSLAETPAERLAATRDYIADVLGN